jgi:hypothetical protein
MITLPILSRERSQNLPFRAGRIHRFVGLCALLLGFAFVSSAFATGPFCAIAYSPATGQWGHGRDYATRALAEGRALSECGTYDARVVAWAYHGYIALAVGGSYYGSGYGSTVNQAKRNALRNCRSSEARVVQTVWSGI